VSDIKHDPAVKGEADHAPSPLPRAQKAFGVECNAMRFGAKRHKK